MRPLILLATLALPLVTPMAALGQLRGGGSDTNAIVMTDCVPGNITCYAQQDAICRQAGGFISLSGTMAGAVTLQCTSDRTDLDRVFADARAQTTTCTAGNLCRTTGPRTGLEASIYATIVYWQNACTTSGGQFEVHALLPATGNDSTLYAGCLRS